MSPKEYYGLLRNHDWHFQRADNYLVWEAGRRSSMRLDRLADMDPELRKLYRAYSRHVFQGEAKPEEPAA